MYYVKMLRIWLRQKERSLKICTGVSSDSTKQDYKFEKAFGLMIPTWFLGHVFKSVRINSGLKLSEFYSHVLHTRVMINCEIILTAL